MKALRKSYQLVPLTNSNSKIKRHHQATFDNFLPITCPANQMFFCVYFQSFLPSCKLKKKEIQHLEHNSKCHVELLPWGGRTCPLNLRVLFFSNLVPRTWPSFHRLLLKLSAWTSTIIRTLQQCSVHSALESLTSQKTS